RDIGLLARHRSIGDSHASQVYGLPFAARTNRTEIAVEPLSGSGVSDSGHLHFDRNALPNPCQNASLSSCTSCQQKTDQTGLGNAVALQAFSQYKKSTE